MNANAHVVVYYVCGPRVGSPDADASLGILQKTSRAAPADIPARADPPCPIPGTNRP